MIGKTEVLKAQCNSDGKWGFFVRTERGDTRWMGTDQPSFNAGLAHLQNSILQWPRNQEKLDRQMAIDKLKNRFLQLRLQVEAVDIEEGGLPTLLIEMADIATEISRLKTETPRHGD